MLYCVKVFLPRCNVRAVVLPLRCIDTKQRCSHLKKCKESMRVETCGSGRASQRYVGLECAGFRGFGKIKRIAQVSLGIVH